MKVCIRKAQLNDLGSIFQIDKEAFTPMNYPLFVLRQYLDIMPDLFLVAIDENEQIIGYTLGGIDSNNKLGWILSLATKKEIKSKGVGYKLTCELIDIFRKKQVEKIKLTVYPDNLAAINLYKKLGFKKIELVQNYYGDNSPRLVMEKKFLNQKKS